MLPPIPPNPEPSAEELAFHSDGLAYMPDRMREGMAKIRWRIARAGEDPNALLVPFATEVPGYRDYLDSALWKRIRRRILKAANHICACCPDKATQVHHRDYRPRVLNGDVTPVSHPAGTGVRSSSNAPNGRPSSSSFSVHRAA